MKSREKVRLILMGIYALFIFLTLSCQSKKNSLFEILPSEETGLNFSNNLTPSLELNVFNYMYFYNGGGVGAGDLNNDGLIDLVFASNQQESKIFLNTGGLKFEDATDASGIFSDDGWATGVLIEDVNQDGLLDIYFSQVSEFRDIHTHNLLFICQGIDENGNPRYLEKSQEFGLDLKGFGTQAAFLDFDLDGDLDLFQLNHSLHQNGTFGQRKSFQNTYHDLSGDKFLRNDKGKFVDVTEEVGINSNVIGYGLGLAVGDLNLDGFPDIYVGNDFHENDYMYINNGNGTFKEKLTEQIMHTSRFSMGVDIGDINNDLHPDIISLDMLPYDPYILKKSEGEDALDIFNFKLNYGYNHQYAKNNLQVNNGNGSFSEVAMYSNIHATDWSWGSLMCDLNNDGLKDIIISNGIPRRMNDIDYINFMADDEVQFRVQFENMEEKDLELINNIPQIALPNKIFLNKGELAFQDLEGEIENNLPGYSNGVIHADFDNDGDLDFVTNNIDDKVMFYENKNLQIKNNFLKVNLRGKPGNIRGVGSAIYCYTNEGVQSYENQTSHGFLSSSATPIHIGLGSVESVDSLIILWPTKEKTVITNPDINSTLEVSQTGGKFEAAPKRMNLNSYFNLVNKADEVKINHLHDENPFVEFNREPLVPHATSTEGPALAIGDFNGDEREDIFVGSSKRKKAKIYLQNPDQSFSGLSPDIFSIDSIHEEVDAVAIDLNNDKFDDLILANGGNEYYFEDLAAQSKILINDRNGGFERILMDSIYTTMSSIEILDIDNDGLMELVLGGRAVSWGYGEIPKSYILRIGKDNKVYDVTDDFCKGFGNIGMVLNLEKVDYDKDGDDDILVALEWGGIKVLENKGGKLEIKEIIGKHGWWQFTKSTDFDNDGDIDIVVGNLGLNSRLKASEERPIRMYYSDFDGNGRKEQILTYHIENKEITFSNMMEIEKQIPVIKKKFVFAKDFAAATLEEIIGKKLMAESVIWSASEFRNGVIRNDGGSYTFVPFKYDMQLSTYKDAVIRDFNQDGLMDMFIVGNFYDNNIQMGRNDADYGSVLLNMGDFNFQKLSPRDYKIKGQCRNVEPIRVGVEELFVVSKNNGYLEIVEINLE